MHCKSLWIKASAKCINVNVNVEPFEAALKLPFGPLIRWIEHLGLHGGK